MTHSGGAMKGDEPTIPAIAMRWMEAFVNDARLKDIIKTYTAEIQEAGTRRDEGIAKAKRNYEADTNESVFQMQLRMSELAKEIIAESATEPDV